MKKKSIFLVLFTFFCAAGYAQDQAAISFVNKDNVYDFGAIAIGDMPVYQFEIKNTGKEKLTITEIKSENTDLRFQWPHKPLKHGKKALIVVTYVPKDGAGTGSFKNDVLITSNATPKPYPFIHVS